MPKLFWIRAPRPSSSCLDANPGLDKMYAVNDGNNEVYYLKDVVADIYGAPRTKPQHFEF